MLIGDFIRKEVKESHNIFFNVQRCSCREDADNRAAKTLFDFFQQVKFENQ